MTTLVDMDQFRFAAPENGEYEIRHDLRSGDRIRFQGREYDFVSRQGSSVTFVSPTDHELIVLTDQRISQEISKGKLVSVWQSGDPETRQNQPLRDRRTVTAVQLSTTDRRLEYVLCVLKGNLDADGSLLREKSYRGRKQSIPIIAAVAARRGEKPPAFSTVLSWVDKWLSGFANGAACLVPNIEFRGNSQPRWNTDVLTAANRAVYSWVTSRLSVTDVHRLFRQEYRQLRRKQGLLGENETEAADELPCIRTLQRWCSLVPAFERDAGRIGPQYAKKKHRVYQTRERPLRPYEIVEFDQHTVHLKLFDRRFGVVLGRPVIILFVDRATGMVVGYAIAFEEPSFASVIEGLRNTMFPKDLSRFPSLVKLWWNPHGRIETLVGDNGRENIGYSMESACRELGMTLRLCRKRQPWEKGQVERAFRSLAEFVCDKLDGATMSNVEDAKKFDDLGEPFLSIEAFEEMLVTWIVAFHNSSETEAVPMSLVPGGPGVPGSKSIPNDNWRNAVKTLSSSVATPVDASVFDALVAEVAERVINEDGIRYDGIKYYDPKLMLLRSKERAGVSTNRKNSLKYVCRRNPNDLSKIWVVDPWETTRVFEIPVCERHRPYTEGTTRRMHALYKQRAREKLKLSVSGTEDAVLEMKHLEEARDYFMKLLVQLTQQPGRMRLEAAASKWLKAHITSLVRSRTDPVFKSESGHIDYFGTGNVSAADVVFEGQVRPKPPPIEESPSPTSKPSGLDAGEIPKSGDPDEEFNRLMQQIIEGSHHE